jgi:protein-S-isoprenylcysteine O-methyltransferase Ste14
MNVPRNVLRFEVLLYASLMLDAISAAFADRMPTREKTEQMIMTEALFGAVMLVLFVYLVWLAAQKRKSWPRWVLLTAFVLSVISLVRGIGEQGIALESGIEMVSCVLTGIGFYFSFTGDAQGWFNA